MPHNDPEPVRPDRRATTAQRGQVLVIFAFLLTILLGMAAFVVDMAWIWSHQLQVQRAADAGALAGVVLLPADPATGIAAAKAESRKNGYTDQPDGQPGPQVVAGPDPNFSRRMIVTVSAPVNTFFLGLFGFHEVTVSRTARAEYILPVPMGSPQNYLGVGRLVQSVLGATQADDWEVPAATGLPSNWCNDAAASVSSSNNTYAGETGGSTCPAPLSGTNPSGTTAAWRDFGISIPTDAEVMGIEVEVEARATAGSCRLGVELSPRADNDTQWTSTAFTVPASSNLTTSDATYTRGGATELWGTTWSEAQVENANFGIRLNRVNVSGCGTVLVDRIRIRVHYATSSDQEVSVPNPYGQALVPQNFWANLQSQGAPSVQGDAYMTKYTTRTSTVNPNYCPWRGYCASNPEGFYNYAVELPAGGEIWVYDPGFCDGSSSRGTGEYWTIGGSNGADPTQTVSAFYRLYNTNNTAWDFSDDTRADSQSGTAVGDGDVQPNTYRRGAANNGAKYYDSTLRSAPTGSGYTDCDGLSWHHNWWQIGSNLPAGTYRLHTTSHDRILVNDQNNTTALNSFAIWASAGGTTVTNVRVYGLGAMEAYFPLPAATVSQFYLAQIEAIHANKWVDISLWDPGDTGGLSADLSVLMPTSGGYVPVDFYYNSVAGTTIPTNFTCGPSTSGQVSSIQTSAGSGGFYNGRWLRLCFQLPDDWSAPTPPVDGLTPTGCVCNGWFRIQYDMGGGSSPSTDLTTWKVEVRGNPVHLITPGDDTPTP
jgi:hypothetical protein